MLMAPGADVAHGRVGPAWLACSALAAFGVIYVMTVRAEFDESLRDGRQPRYLLLALAALTYATNIAFGHSWILLFILLSLACGALLGGKQLAIVLLLLSSSDGAISGFHGGGVWASAATAYGTFLSGLVTAAILSLHQLISQLRPTRQKLARAPVSQERLRFSRDLHDLLGHTMSVVAVKAEAVRRLAPRDLDAALSHASDIESVSRQALTEIREAVSGYRNGSLTAELERARSVLDASGIAVTVQESGPPLASQTEALVGWVVREGVTNVVRHSGASSCRIELDTDGDRAVLRITDDGDGSGAGSGACAQGGGWRAGGTGLKGLAERMSMAGGSLTAGPAPRRGFQLTAELPVEEER
ncbi:sensor histidine kinase [Streptantibioticus ferralitis]|uniref:Histidine kinase n=1 Tax=Streptantibioticus ferralitis TaxID=236510 RepID=A0ABT5Z224_9ACTN|nr:histidine kinase [Streptantibioticus ferralitis]MDF2257626.1 histidine kinase [Streptantibioticus ferralitis]